MFTGIITGVGRIAAVHDLGSSSSHGKRLSIAAPAGYLDDVGLGDSIALNGACMTVTTLDPAQQQLHHRHLGRSLDKTAGLAERRPRSTSKRRCAPTTGSAATSVSGHVDGIGTVTPLRAGRRKLGAARRWRRAALARFLAYKGSITVNGVSLTVNSVERRRRRQRDQHQPDPAHGARTPRSAACSAGSRVNLEIDLIARYVERMLQPAPSRRP